MRQIISRREIVADEWRYPGEVGAAPAVLSLAQLLAAQIVPAGTAAQLEPDDDVERLAPHLGKIVLLVIHFPKNGEGRGFSQARMLRERYGYAGPMRASGPIKRDYLYLLARCGFDSFDLDPGEDLASAVTALDAFTVAYQRGSDRLIAPRYRQIG
ncbi:MAG TPA: DUF934 domain-containing protein [Steroidobacteraceae bacterium]|nr:DUF934 domain-containing protein [Steroidobacteraceae bacterium]